MAKHLAVKTGATLLVLIMAFSISSCAHQTKQPEQKSQKEQAKQVVMKKVKIPVDGMTCSACQSNVKRTLKSINGVSDVEVSLEKKYAIFLFDPQKVKVEQVQKAIYDKGYTAGKPQEVKQ
ncbi:MAG: heavy-metal-associated domain-containing protein [Sphingobacteriales bacterium]|nr:heavy-metal-associated domain-containing protein [Sphingobacteriales bacterium]